MNNSRFYSEDWQWITLVLVGTLAVISGLLAMAVGMFLWNQEIVFYGLLAVAVGIAVNLFDQFVVLGGAAIRHYEELWVKSKQEPPIAMIILVTVVVMKVVILTGFVVREGQHSEPSYVPSKAEIAAEEGRQDPIEHEPVEYYSH